MHLPVHTISDTTVRLEPLWPNPQGEGESRQACAMSVSVCGQQACEVDSFLQLFLKDVSLVEQMYLVFIACQAELSQTTPLRVSVVGLHSMCVVNCQRSYFPSFVDSTIPRQRRTVHGMGCPPFLWFEIRHAQFNQLLCSSCVANLLQ